ncbi:piggyBac transposable element-derived protein 3-like [Calliphora vicina]|uniref:piggyBac transposable element-derived protein 3-like n=1 Tax=Calliphora vicina TaxID=7373 RepID=UPI00325AFB2C
MSRKGGLTEDDIFAEILNSDLEDFSSDDECVDATWELPVVTNDLADQESDNEEEFNALSETPPESSQTANRRDIWKKRPFENQLESSSYATADTNTPIETPYHYFSVYFNDEFLEKVTEYTNRYHVAEKGKALGASVAEMKNFFGIIIAMGCIRYPRLRMYWEKTTRLPIVADTMSRDRFFLLRMCLHVVDNNEVTDAEKQSNVFWKINPLLERVRSACRNIPRKCNANYSIDEQMIPFTGRCPVRQSLPNKPRGVGLKNEVLTTSEGLVLDFEIYQGKTTPLPCSNLGLGPGFVLRLAETLPEGSKLFFDRYFTTIPLLQALLKRGIYATGTIMRNRIKNVHFTNEKHMKRGDMEEFCHSEDNIVVVQWKDSKSVILASSAYGCGPVEHVKRWEKKEKRYVEVPAPRIVREYNKCMGGVDVCDQLMESYRSFFKTRKWTLKVFIHFIDLVCCNAWMQYRDHCKINSQLRKNTHDLLSFKIALAKQLVAIDTKKNNEYESEDEDEEPQNVAKKYRPSEQPCQDKRLDGYKHWPLEHDLSSARCCRLAGLQLSLI